MKKTSVLGSVIAAGILSAAALTAPAQASDIHHPPATLETETPIGQPETLPDDPTNDEFVDFVKQYRLVNPHDLVGLDKIVRAHTGKGVETSVDGSAPLSATEAQERYDRFLAAESTPKTQDGVEGAVPVDAFIVFLQTYPSPSGGAVVVMGSWDWRDDFVGQGNPMDLAAIELERPTCVEVPDPEAAAAYWDEDLGPSPTLREAGLNGGGVVWNVDARPIGFENQADHGVVTVTADAQNCPDPTVRIGAAFSYEANNGGSVLGVSAGWGAFNVSYSPEATFLRKSTAAVYTSGETLLRPTGEFFSSQAVCREWGAHGVSLGTWTKYVCAWEAASSEWQIYAD